MTLDPNPALSPSALLDGLNPAQAEAATHPSGPLLIVAGPGSGKTRVIAHRIAWLVQEQGIRPHQILGVTFTKKAARELRDRVAALFSGYDSGESTEGMSLGTFHSTCARILRVDGAAIGIPREFVIYDDADQDLVIRRALADLSVDPKHYGPRTVRSAISRAKNEGLPVAEYRNRAGNYFEEVVGRLYEHYEATLKQNNALDFDDLLTRTVDLFDTQPQVAERYQRRFRHTLVDEFQDTNLIQYDLTRHWAAGSNNLTVVGDPDQSIYSWRAADIRNILYFERDFPDAAVVRLEQNYRSTKAILRVADAVIDRASERIHKQLWTDNDQGINPVVYEAYSESDEADFVTQEIENHLGTGEPGDHSLGTGEPGDSVWRPGDVAIMYRTNAQSRVIEESFLRRGIPYRVVGGTRFYARREVKDILAYLRLISNPTDTVAFQRIINVPARALGQKSQGELLVWAEENGLSPLDAAAYAGQSDGPKLTARAARACLAFAQMIQDAQEVAKTGTLEEVIDILLRETGYQDFLFRDFDDAEDRWQNVLELRTVASNYTEIAPEAALATFLEDVALVADVDSMGDEAPQAVTLITLHAAK
ncbi:MAG TPA: UvrD-helicase domain-containing protein, partial [Dehalococcoidia bacterium]|nr:UvrD-helicase domain-containing protein [Dehalococcoidia bacterium]